MELLEHYDYTIPPEQIAQTAAIPRDSARLFVYDTVTDTVTLATFKDIAHFLPSPSLMVLNNTKVIPARVCFTKKTGGKIGGLLLVNEGFTQAGEVRAIAEKTLPINKEITIGEYLFLVTHQEENIFFLKPLFPLENLEQLLLTLGTTPIPPYILHNTQSETELREQYQTLFASKGASVAAPTASLHFTPEVFTSLSQKGILQKQVTLNVGMGTFAPVREEHLREKRLHLEHAEVPLETARQIRESKRDGTPIIAVGTTVVRTLESTAAQILTSSLDEDIQTNTDLFIIPPYTFNIVDILVTNFHVPKSSLLCLVDAFLQNKQARRNVLDLYSIAIAEKFRFYSFGDAMLIL